jgi:signal transduction histidine kinase
MQQDFFYRSWLFGLLILIAVAVPGAFTVASFNAYRQSAGAISRSEELRGEIRRLDEVLTMSARMAATTGDESWIARYNDNVGPLDYAIKEMLDLASSPQATAMVRATDDANAALIAMETRSFELVQEGRSGEALALLTSPEYERQKAIYAEGMNRAMTIVRAGFAGETDQSSRNLLIASLLAVVGVVACFLTWIRLMRKSFREQERLRALAVAERDAATAASAAKSRFLANMSHELRTPLNAVIGYSEMLREGAEEDGRKSDITDHDRVIGAARRLLTLIDDLLDISKAEAGKIVLKPRAFDVRTLVEATLATIAPAAASRGNRTRLAVANDIGIGVTDEFRLGQCLLNLLSNAAKFTRDGEISLSAHRHSNEDEDWLVFEVTDTGIGMSPAQVEELFQPFVQVEAAVSQAHGGTGLGLAITRQLARLLGGDVEVRSVMGQGSTFTLRAPARLPSQEPSALVPVETRTLAAA